MRYSPIVMALILIACVGCQTTDTDHSSGWPRMSFQARLLIVPQDFLDEFAPDDDDRALRLEGDERSDWSRTITQLEAELLLNATHANEYALDLMAPRVVARNDSLVFVTLKPQLRFEFVGSDGSRDSDSEPGWRGLELGLACDPAFTASSCAANLRVDARLIGRRLNEETDEVEPVTLDLWKPATQSFSAADGKAWLISLPYSQTRQVAPDSDGQARRFLLLIRPVLLRSEAHEQQLFPGLPETGGFMPNDS
jgi:hypothetical protein